MGQNKATLVERAKALSIADAENMTKAQLTSAIQAAEAATPADPSGETPPHVLVIPAAGEGGELEISVNAQGLSLMEVPSLLALAKKRVEEKLGI